MYKSASRLQIVFFSPPIDVYIYRLEFHIKLLHVFSTKNVLDPLVFHLKQNSKITAYLLKFCSWVYLVSMAWTLYSFYSLRAAGAINTFLSNFGFSPWKHPCNSWPLLDVFSFSWLAKLFGGKLFLWWVTKLYFQVKSLLQLVTYMS